MAKAKATKAEDKMRVELPENHDIDMEVLCTLSPTSKSQSEVARTVGLSVNGIEGVIKRLQDKGFAVIETRLPWGNGTKKAVRIDQNGWADAKSQCSAYWARVNQ